MSDELRHVAAPVTPGDLVALVRIRALLDQKAYHVEPAPHAHRRAQA
jgi:hypothetical protein